MQNSRLQSLRGGEVLVSHDVDSHPQLNLASSRRRSFDYHKLDSLDQRPPAIVTGSELDVARKANEPLLRMAKATTDRLYAATCHAGSCILLSNIDGLTIDRRGSPTDDLQFKKLGLWSGSMWSETLEGTNGIGTCLVEQRTVTVHLGQHYRSRNMSLSCTAAPIFDQDGNLLATIDVSSLRADLDHSYLALLSISVSEAARRIEAEYFRSSFPGCRIVMAPIAYCPSNALLAIDADDLVIGATRAACVRLGIRRSSLNKPLLLEMITGDLAVAPNHLELAELGAIRKALARAGGNVSVSAKALGISRATLHRKLKRMPK